MNWQASKAAPGQFVTMQIVVTEIKHMTGQYGAYALGKGQDGPGEIVDCMFTVAKDKVLPPDLASRPHDYRGWEVGRQHVTDEVLLQRLRAGTSTPSPPSPTPTQALLLHPHQHPMW